MIFKSQTANIPIFIGVPSQTLTVYIAKDGGSFSQAAGTVTEAASGLYWLAATTEDTNGHLLALLATAEGCTPYYLTLVTEEYFNPTRAVEIDYIKQRAGL